MNNGAAGKAEAEDARNFVKGLARGVIAGSTDAHEIAVAAHEHEIRMSAGDDEAEEWELRLWLVRARFGRRGQPVGVDVPFKVVDAEKWQVAGEGEGLCGVQSDQQRAGQSGPAGARDEIYVIPVDLGLLHRIFHDRDDRLNVRS